VAIEEEGPQMYKQTSSCIIAHKFNAYTNEHESQYEKICGKKGSDEPNPYV